MTKSAFARAKGSRGGWVDLGAVPARAGENRWAKNRLETRRNASRHGADDKLSLGSVPLRGRAAPRIKDTPERWKSTASGEGKGPWNGLSALFRGGSVPPQGRAALSHFCAYRALCGDFPRGALAAPRRARAGRHDLVLQRLSRHGPASRGHRRHGRDRAQGGRGRRRNAQHLRHELRDRRIGA